MITVKKTAKRIMLKKKTEKTDHSDFDVLCLWTKLEGSDSHRSDDTLIEPYGQR